MTDRGDSGDRERLGRDPERVDRGDDARSDAGRSDAGRADEIRDDTSRDANRGVDRDPGHDRSDTDRGQVENPNRGKGWGITALIFGILALLGSLFGFLNLVFALPALVLGIVAMVKGSRGLGIAAIVLSILAIVIGIVLTLLAGAAIMSSPEFQQLLQEAEQQSQ